MCIYTLLRTRAAIGGEPSIFAVARENKAFHAIALAFQRPQRTGTENQT